VFPAAGAAGQPPAWSDPSDETVVDEKDLCNEKVGDPDECSGKLGDAHCLLLLLGVLVDTKKHGKPCAFQFMGDFAMKTQPGSGSERRRGEWITHSG
jgi:hypothetical protein